MDNQAEINLAINTYLAQALAGQSVENPKFDFKTKWYNLRDNKEINEFLKDTTAIANTIGLDGFIVIGYDEKSRTFKNTYFTDCGLKDTNEVTGIINKRVDRLFTLNVIDFSF